MLYIYDGSFDGAMSAIFAAYNDRSAQIVPRDEVQTVSLYEERFIDSDAGRSERLQRGLARLARGVPERFYRAWLSHSEGVEDLMLAVARIGFESGSDPFAQRGFDAVCELDALAGKVSAEQHRMLQFVRFVRVGPDAFAADIEPQYEVLPLIGRHFHSRFPDSHLIIRDLPRRMALVSEPAGWQIVRLGENNPPLPDDGPFEKMWREYYDAIAIEGRLNPKLQRQNVPLKYRRNMTEFAAPRGGGVAFSYPAAEDSRGGLPAARRNRKK